MGGLGPHEILEPSIAVDQNEINEGTAKPLKLLCWSLRGGLNGKKKKTAPFPFVSLHSTVQQYGNLETRFELCIYLL